MARVTNIKLVGVGGQGILLATELLSEALLRAGHDVKTSEVHGMAQRGGSVFSDVRFGPRVYSPLIPDGETHLLVGFEQIEAVRHLGSLARDGIAVVSKQIILPLGVTLGLVARPRDLLGRIRALARKLEIIDAPALARKAGSARAANTVTLGALSRHLEVAPQLWAEVLRERLGARLLEANLRAFELGRSQAVESTAL